MSDDIKINTVGQPKLESLDDPNKRKVGMALRRHLVTMAIFNVICRDPAPIINVQMIITVFC